jgi:outer membrane protein TolC
MAPPIAAAALLTGCAVGPDYHPPQMPLPDHYVAQQQPPGASGIDLASWWHALKDPELDSLIDRAIAANPDVNIALDHLQEARTYEAGMLGVVLPNLEGSAAAARGTGSDLDRGRAPQSLISADNAAGTKQINEIGGFDTAWELDIFGKYRR